MKFPHDIVDEFRSYCIGHGMNDALAFCDRMSESLCDGHCNERGEAEKRDAKKEGGEEE